MEIKIEFLSKKLEDDIFKQLMSLVEYNESKGRSNYTEADAKQDMADTYGPMADMFVVAHLQLISAAIAKIDEWAGSSVTIEMSVSNEPLYFGEEDVWIRGACSVYVYKGRVWSHSTPSFTLFTQDGAFRAVDDILDAGDEDFFQDPAEQADYFALINELKHPGKTRNFDKVLRLFTARPKRDRALYEGATTIPSNVFLTTSEDEAYGYAADMGARDVYLVRVRAKFLLETLNAMGRKNFQSFSAAGDAVPVESIHRVSD